jgi:4-carboxymuconolactone decarboxylase
LKYNLHRERRIIMSKEELPRTFKSIVERYPEVWEAHEQLTKACAEAGPFDRKTVEIIKVGMCVGAGLETATQRHALMARENGATDEEIYQAVLMAMTTLGHPRSAAGWKWVNSALEGSD